MLVEVSLATALLCAAGECWPVLLGASTPAGDFALTHVKTRQRGYGGDILLFLDRKDGWYAIHRTWPGRERLYANASAYRRHISHGCINVQPELYDFLVASGASRVVIRP